jgi:hypothetical protein
MNLIFIALLTVAGSLSVAGLTFAAYASMPEKFLEHAKHGRYSGLTASAPSAASAKRAPVQIGSLQDQSA